MKKVIILILISFFAFSSAVSFGQTQTLEELESAGLKHYQKAYYQAIPQKNRALADEEFARAEKAFRQAIQKRPERVQAYLHLGLTYAAQKKYAAAAETYRSALAIAPRDKRIYLWLASALEKNGNYRDAISALEELRALEHDERAILIIDDFISKLEDRAAGVGPESSPTGEQP